MAKKITRELPVLLSDNRKKKLGDELAHLTVTIDLKQDDFRATSKAKAKEIRDLKKDQSRIGKALDTGKELVEVQCEERQVFAQNKVEVVRKDTGEIVETRAMTGDERQLDITEAGGSKKKLKGGKAAEDEEK